VPSARTIVVTRGVGRPSAAVEAEAVDSLQQVEEEKDDEFLDPNHVRPIFTASSWELQQQSLRRQLEQLKSETEHAVHSGLRRRLYLEKEKVELEKEIGNLLERLNEIERVERDKTLIILKKSEEPQVVVQSIQSRVVVLSQKVKGFCLRAKRGDTGVEQE